VTPSISDGQRQASKPLNASNGLISSLSEISDASHTLNRQILSLNRQILSLNRQF
jgi:hypothetical protein